MVIGAIARKGNVVAKVVHNTDTALLDGFVRRVADKDKVDLIATDELGYRMLSAMRLCRMKRSITDRANTCAGSLKLRISKTSGDL